jgi:hypothetical protein
MHRFPYNRIDTAQKSNGKQLYFDLRKYNHCSLRRKAYMRINIRFFANLRNAQIPTRIYEIRKVTATIDFRGSPSNYPCPIFTGSHASCIMIHQSYQKFEPSCISKSAFADSNFQRRPSRMQCCGLVGNDIQCY